MSYLTIPSPVGSLSLFEADGVLVALEWGQAGDGGGETPLLAEAARQLEAYFAGDLQTFDLPLIESETDHAARVRAAMIAVPFGETRTYGDIAKAIGSNPRAVGGACGRNPIPIIIPCHRVVGANGKLTGFSGGEGVETKEALLRLESSLLL
ncbi:MAG: methylated-DNA--[protein]-cysteine S-methyltransferase [Magnetovibrionaceae bacterium]